MNETLLTKFDSLGISLSFLKAIRDMGFETATKIQSESIQIMKLGKDVIAQSQTGTGKTLAFGIPCLESIDCDSNKIQCIILCPTRELAMQITNEFNKLLKYSFGIKTLAVYGGQSIEHQIIALKKGVQIVIGTPGRIMDHMRRKTIKLDKIQTVVLDEADEMLDMGFREDIETILQGMPEQRQIMLYSATLSKEILNLAKNYTTDAEIIKIEAKELSAPNIEQHYFSMNHRDKFESLSCLLKFHNPNLTMVFCNTKKCVDDISEMLKSKGFQAEGLHGDLKQEQRDNVMNSFRKQRTKILIATDVAARGIDVDDIDIVFNYDIPSNEEQYVHRIGRTGRAGRKGRAFTFVVGKEINRIYEFSKLIKCKIENKRLPSERQIVDNQISLFLKQIDSSINNDLDKYNDFIENHLKDIDPTKLNAALLQMFMTDNSIFKKIEELKNPKIEELKKPYVNKNEDYSNNKKVNKPNKYSKKGKKVKLQINIGQSQNIKPRDIVDLITNETGISSHSIGEINIFENYSTLDIEENNSKSVISMSNSKRIKGKKIKIMNFVAI